MRIAIGCDHRGIELKKNIMQYISENGHIAQDMGAFTTDAVDYPDIARSVGETVVQGNCAFGMLICDTGIGMSIAANKVNGIRAALCHDEFQAMRSRLHNNANVMCMGAHDAPDEYPRMVIAFLSTSFEGGRHQARLDKISRMEDC